MIMTRIWYAIMIGCALPVCAQQTVDAQHDRVTIQKNFWKALKAGDKQQALRWHAAGGRIEDSIDNYYTGRIQYNILNELLHNVPMASLLFMTTQESSDSARNKAAYTLGFDPNNLSAGWVRLSIHEEFRWTYNFVAYMARKIARHESGYFDNRPLTWFLQDPRFHDTRAVTEALSKIHPENNEGKKLLQDFLDSMDPRRQARAFIAATKLASNA